MPDRLPFSGVPARPHPRVVREWPWPDVLTESPDEIYLSWYEIVREGKEVNEFYAKKNGKYYLIDKKGNIKKENVPFNDIKNKIKKY